MYDGIFLGAFLIFLACAVIDLTSGNFARAGAAGTILFIVLCIGLGSVSRDHREKKERIERLKKWCPGHPDAYYKHRVTNNLDGGDVFAAMYKKEVAILKQQYPGKPEWWYRQDFVNRSSHQSYE